MVATYETSGFDTSKLKPFLPEQDRKVRTHVIEGLESYAELLAAISGDQPLTQVDASAKAMGASLQGLSAIDLGNAKLTATNANLATTAIDALGRALVEQKRRRDLPGILHQMQEPIETICKLLEQDIGDPAGSGLRNELHISYLDLIREEKNYLADNGGKLLPAERREEIRSLGRLAASEAQGDHALAETQSTLARLARAHTALAETAGQKSSPVFQVQMEQLAESVQQLKSFYDTLPSRN